MGRSFLLSKSLLTPPNFPGVACGRYPVNTEAKGSSSTLFTSVVMPVPHSMCEVNSDQAN